MSWKIEKGYMPGIYNVYDNENNPVAVDCTKDRARLIAAAPDLLEVLRGYVALDDARKAGREVTLADWAEVYQAGIEAIRRTE